MHERSTEIMDFRYSLPANLELDFSAAVTDWEKGKIERLWARDASLWTNQDESKWLGWLDIVERQQKDLEKFRALAQDIQSAGFQYALLLGMGGSSLCPEVLAETFGQQTGFPRLSIVDSTDPAQVRTAEQSVDLKKTVIIVSSKSGSTLEPNILKQYFMARMKDAVGGEAGKRFIAVTDPGSHMEQVARADGFRNTFYGDPLIGGRYSALSNFGMIPAAVMGLDVEKLLAKAKIAVDFCHSTDVKKNPGVELGLILGVAANAGRDKITFFTSPPIYDMGAWFEQLIAESTGKQGKGITPVDLEEIGDPDVYGNDRVFAYVRLEGADNAHVDAAVEKLEKAGQPVVRLAMRDIYDTAEQFFTWEIATAVAGSIIGIDAFNQPDVEAAKIEARRLTDEYQKTGKLPEQTPIFDDGKVKLFADPKYAAVLHGGQDVGQPDLAGYLRAHLAQLKSSDYFAVLGFIQSDREHQKTMQRLRHKVRDNKKVATCLGFGPRFLHSTGQDYKGGPNIGVFLQITTDHAKDLAIPDEKYTFGVVIDAQAAGDLNVLQQRGRRALRAHLGDNVEAGLVYLADAVEKALR
ncbi:MAG TPA: bifunctional transaldolase/phosoglucose isomerase [Acidobacteriaceae bacterium]|nr:bifunctional transaldolase/phosoglucose isomerase [Acidobacteriaceae bacterium]